MVILPYLSIFQHFIETFILNSFVLVTYCKSVNTGNVKVQRQQKIVGHQREDFHEASSMTLEDQSRKAVRKPGNSLLDPRSKTRLGC